MIKKIISGGLPGVELAALDAAIKLDIPHEGWTYKSRKSYFERLKKNIIGSHGTVILTYGQLIRGSNATKDLANKHTKPCLLLELNECTRNHAISSIRKWMDNHEIEEIS
jgi:hypothetical protein